MDDFINPFIPSSTWADANPSARPSWNETVVSQTTSLLADSMEAYGGNGKIPPTCMIPSGRIMENAAADDLNLHGHDGGSSIFINGTLKKCIDKDVFPGEKLSQQMLNGQTLNSSLRDTETHENFSLEGVVGSNLPAGSFEQELNTECSVPLPHSSLESNVSELSAFQHSFGDSNSISSVPTIWPSSYSSVSSFMGHEKLTAFGLHGVESNDEILRKTYIDNAKFPQLDDISATSLHDHNARQRLNLPSFATGNQMDLTSGGLLPCHEEENSLHNLHLPSLASGPQMTLSKTASIQAHQQLSPSFEGNAGKHHANHSSNTEIQPASANAGGCNGAVRPRIRARRGQATDPHSIAERLRREKIAERMKNLQELVPNANKTDKASMLDEIIDYVKFLQLQVKVLSMSRLGAAGAVVPLLTDAQAEGSGSLLLSSPVAQSGADLPESQDSLAFEQEVVKLMESNVTTAMQYLQNKGLCLMPIALAAAISNQKGSSTAFPPDHRKHVPHGLVPQSTKSFMERNNVADGAHGCNSVIVKQEESQKPIANSGELKPEA